MFSDYKLIHIQAGFREENLVNFSADILYWYIVGYSIKGCAVHYMERKYDMLGYFGA